MSREVMDAPELAEYLGIAVSTVYKKVEQRELPFTKVGSLLRFPKWLIDQWLTKRAIMPVDKLFERFARLQQRYHVEQFMQARGLDITRMDEAQLVDELKRAIDEVKKDIEAERQDEEDGNGPAPS
jgi:excisionase family DNA binding protein